MNIVFLAAGKSSRIYKEVGKPKCLLKINNQSIISSLLKNLRGLNIKKINIVVGFKSYLIKKELKKNKKISYIYNKYYNSREMLYSLILALKKIDDDIIFSYTDIIYDRSIIKKLISKKNNIYLPILKNWKNVWIKRKKEIKSDAEDLQIDKNSNLKTIGKKITDISKVKYQFMGLVMINKENKKEIIRLYNSAKNNKKIHLTNFLNLIVKKKINIKCLKYLKNWYEFDDIDDYLNYKKKL
jgi:phosphoenolpyruvate phosphomutase